MLTHSFTLVMDVWRSFIINVRLLSASLNKRLCHLAWHFKQETIYW